MKKINKKTIILITLIAALVVVALLVFFLFLNKGDSYRILKVFEVEGTANVNRTGKGDITPYTNMVLESGDRISLDTGKMTLQADEDKYIFLEEHTELVLTASGDAANSKTTIELVKGGITNEIQNKLSGDSSYEINTPNSTMSVRGTVYYVYEYEEDGIIYTRVCVFQGAVATWLTYEDGTKAEEQVLVPSGKEVLIYQDDKTTDYVYEPKDIDYDTLPDSVLEKLQEIIASGEDLSITDEEIVLILEGPYTVTFKYNGEVFGTQTVEKGKTASKPALQPSTSGSWKFDFSKPIERDTIINWEP